jgi:hypothetical protein
LLANASADSDRVQAWQNDLDILREGDMIAAIYARKSTEETT